MSRRKLKCYEDSGKQRTMALDTPKDDEVFKKYMEFLIQKIIFQDKQIGLTLLLYLGQLEQISKRCHH